jgi:hypothetical protein
MKKIPTTPPAEQPSTATTAPDEKLTKLYARLERTKPGFDESKRVSAQILEEIFDRLK